MQHSFNIHYFNKDDKTNVWNLAKIRTKEHCSVTNAQWFGEKKPKKGSNESNARVITINYHGVDVKGRDEMFF
jgi:hypothetical protein